MKLLPLSFIVGLALPLFSRGDPDGIYADFSTSMGDFTATLNYTAAPQTVANFIGLAEGSRSWVDQATGAIQKGKPFYNGVIFHRVIADFMIQTGSPNGQGTDGPGYAFKDETSNGLFHNAPYKLSMANAGLNTNGSQFFVTVVPTPWLDGVHTVFGEVTAGQTVVDQINGVATGANNKPVTPVTLHSVAIRRVGAAAVAFNVHAQGLPVCSGSVGKLEVVKNVSETWAMPVSPPVGSVMKFSHSHDLQSWNYLGQIYRSPGNADYTGVTIGSADAPRAFYHVANINYPGTIGPSSLAGRTLILNIPGGVYTFVFDNTGNAGTASRVQGGTTYFNFAVYDQGDREPYSFKTILQTNLPGYAYLLLRCGYQSETAGTWTGKHTLDYFSGGWVRIGDGMMTLSK